jgi:hypothetical protein
VAEKSVRLNGAKSKPSLFRLQRTFQALPALATDVRGSWTLSKNLSAPSPAPYDSPQLIDSLFALRVSTGNLAGSETFFNKLLVD